MLKKPILLAISILLLNPPLTIAQEIVTQGHVQVQLIPEDQSIQPGKSFEVAVHLKMEEGWHVYWKNPGDSGLPVSVRWDLPDRLTAGPLQWPFPGRVNQPPLTSYGYTGDVLLPTTIDAPGSLNAGIDETLKADVHWLVCQVDCIPGNALVTLRLPVKNEAPPPDSHWSNVFQKTRSDLPLEKSPWTLTASASVRTLFLTLHYSGKNPYPLSDVYFFPDSDSVIRHAESQILTKVPDGFLLQVARSSLSSAPLLRLQGVLVTPEGWQGPGTAKALAIDVPVQNASIKETALPQAKRVSLMTILCFAFLGGLILNLMPCVLPVLSLKILGLVRRSRDNRIPAWRHGAAFTGGVLVSFWILAGLLIAFRSAGLQIGWGFQFQSPLFLIALSALFLVFALNLFGIFEITLPFQISLSREHSGLVRDFFNGVLATITATPCTAPFMGTALGFCLTQPPPISLAVFTSLGLGMACPYLLLSCFPALLGFLPKPGAWMILFKRFLGILLLGTVIWLWGVLAVRIGIIQQNPSTTTHDTNRISWQSYSPPLIDQLLAEKRRIFIDFTAKWCLTCQVNEKIALDNPRVIKKFRELNVALVKADLTFNDPEITAALTKMGRDSIPFYVLYGNTPGKWPVVLPELLTPGKVLQALEKTDE